MAYSVSRRAVPKEHGQGRVRKQGGRKEGRWSGGSFSRISGKVKLCGLPFFVACVGFAYRFPYPIPSFQ